MSFLDFYDLNPFNSIQKFQQTNLKDLTHTVMPKALSLACAVRRLFYFFTSAEIS